MYTDLSKRLEDRFSYMKALADELRGIAFHIENTAASEYGNSGCEHGKYKIIDDGGQTRTHDANTLKKVATLFDDFWGKSRNPEQ